MFSVGIIGLPNVGKSTLFKALTKIAVPIADYPFTTIDPHHGIVKVKDKKLKKIAELIKPQKTTHCLIEFIDIAGLVEGAHKGEGLGNKFLSNITEADVLLEVIRNFSVSQKILPEKEELQHPQYNLWEDVNPKRDIEIIKNEIIKRDEKIISKFIESKEIKKEEKNIAEKLLKLIRDKSWPNDVIRNLKPEESLSIEKLGKKRGIISIKPIIYLFNITEKNKKNLKENDSLFLNLKRELEISDLTEKEREEIGELSNLDDIILTCYNKLDLITFYTIKGGEEVRATELKKGSNILEAAEKIHTDFKEKFVRAEVLSFGDFINYGSWHKARENGLLKIKGKEYIVQNEDIIEFKI